LVSSFASFPRERAEHFDDASFAGQSFCRAHGVVSLADLGRPPLRDTS
jgi:hypothetical protein